MRNKLSFLLLILLYFTAETIGNAGLLMVQWTIEKDAPRNGYAVLVQLTANWPIRVWRSILNSCVLHVLLQGLKRRRNELALSDLLGIRNIMSWKLFVAMFVSDVILASPMTIAQALMSSDLVWAVVYLLFGFFLNWLFGFAQVLLFEDPSLSLMSCLVWSASAALDPSTFAPVLISCLSVFLTTPLIVTTPFLLVLQLLTFFEVFGYRSPAEIYYTPGAES
jgi:hypothetical protein